MPDFSSIAIVCGLVLFGITVCLILIDYLKTWRKKRS